MNGELLWSQDGNTYSARMEFRHFLMGSRVQTSTGTLGPWGLEPIRFGDKVKSEWRRISSATKARSVSARIPPTPCCSPVRRINSACWCRWLHRWRPKGAIRQRGTVLAFQAGAEVVGNLALHRRQERVADPAGWRNGPNPACLAGSFG